MAGLHGVVIPSGLAFAVKPVRGLLDALGVRFADTSGTVLLMTYGWVTALLAIAFLFPNSQQILARFDPVLEASARPAGGGVRGPAVGFVVGMAALRYMGVRHWLRGLHCHYLDHAGQRISLLAILRRCAPLPMF